MHESFFFFAYPPSINFGYHLCRYDYLSNAVVQARSGSRSPRGLGQAPGFSESGFLEVLESKLAVLRFQLKIKEMLDHIASAVPSVPLETGTTNSLVPTEENGFPSATAFADENRAQAAREKSEELNAELKNITQLYNDFAVPFELWEVIYFHTTCFLFYKVDQY